MWQFEVPNAPCGVESRKCSSFANSLLRVPNAPCGVESVSLGEYRDKLVEFLMHRVELKVRSCGEDTGTVSSS